MPPSRLRLYIEGHMYLTTRFKPKTCGSRPRQCPTFTSRLNSPLLNNHRHSVTPPTMAKFSLLSLLSLLTLTQPTLSLRPSPGCNKTPALVTTSSTTTPLRITSNNKQREFFVRLPPNYNSSIPHRLIFTLHALGGTAQQVIAGQGGYLPYYGLPPLINDSTPAVFVIPNGLNNGWQNAAGEDVTFLRAVLSAVESDLCIDQDLRFSTGFSYGGAMSYSLACSLGKEIRAVAALSGNPQISGCAAGSEPVAYYGQHGTTDNVLPLAQARQMRDRFLKNNGCAAQAEPAVPASGSQRKVKTVYSGCQPDKPVTFVVFDGGHVPTPREPGESETFTHKETWEFFSQFK
ncbi:Alpha/Beta hydrolase protein [Triangularia setosa]|uniref:feruloyl esterase n=1 Tax=Triangularia setosa TaxID=2587417 RepID=A0AAN6W781_9PEZI|nr:Alpha/Beta hydrolase protein [Podospora setosa]